MAGSDRRRLPSLRAERDADRHGVRASNHRTRLHRASHSKLGDDVCDGPDRVTSRHDSDQTQRRATSRRRTRIVTIRRRREVGQGRPTAARRLPLTRSTDAYRPGGDQSLGDRRSSWGPVAAADVGRRSTLYRDAHVTFGGLTGGWHPHLAHVPHHQACRDPLTEDQGQARGLRQSTHSPTHPSSPTPRPRRASRSCGPSTPTPPRSDRLRSGPRLRCCGVSRHERRMGPGPGRRVHRARLPVCGGGSMSACIRST